MIIDFEDKCPPTCLFRTTRVVYLALQSTDPIIPTVALKKEMLEGFFLFGEKKNLG